MKKTLLLTALASVVFAPAVYQLAHAQSGGTPTGKGFNDTEQILERALQIEDIEYKIMVQRATQTAIWAMPAAGMFDFIKATRRDAGGDIILSNLTQPVQHVLSVLDLADYLTIKKSTQDALAYAEAR